MSRTLTPDGLTAILSETTDQVILFALIINHPDLAQPYKLVQNKTDLSVDINGAIDTFTAFAFEVSLPDFREDSVPSSKIKLDNIDQFLINLLRTSNVAPEIEVYVIRKDPLATNAVKELGPMTFTLKTVDWDIRTISGDLTLDYDYLNEACMKYRFTPEIAIGLFNLSYEG